MCIGRTAEGVIINGTEDQSEARVAVARRGLVRAGDRGVIDEAHSGFNHAKVEGLIRRAGLRYLPGIDLGQQPALLEVAS